MPAQTRRGATVQLDEFSLGIRCQVGTPTTWTLSAGLPAGTLVELLQLLSPSGAVLVSNSPAQTLMPVPPAAGGFAVATGTNRTWSLQFPDPAPTGVVQAKVRLTVVYPSGQQGVVTSATFDYPSQPAVTRHGCGSLSYTQSLVASLGRSSTLVTTGTLVAGAVPGYYGPPPYAVTPIPVTSPLNTGQVWTLSQCEWIGTNGDTIKTWATNLPLTTQPGFSQSDLVAPSMIIFSPPSRMVGSTGRFAFFYTVTVQGSPLTNPVVMFSPLVTLASLPASSP